MKVGDLVRCIWQPRTSKYVEGIGCIPMKHHIKGEVGIVTGLRRDGGCLIMFTQFGYTHPLANSAFEILNDS